MQDNGISTPQDDRLNAPHLPPNTFISSLTQDLKRGWSCSHRHFYSNREIFVRTCLLIVDCITENHKANINVSELSTISCLKPMYL